MRETPNKYKLPVNFSKSKLAWYPLANKYYSNESTFLQIHHYLLQYICKVNLKIVTPTKFKCKYIRNFLENAFHKKIMK